MKLFEQTHGILEIVECFSQIGIQYKTMFPVKIKTKPCVFILHRKQDATDPVIDINMSELPQNVIDDMLDQSSFEDNENPEYLVEETENDNNVIDEEDVEVEIQKLPLTEKFTKVRKSNKLKKMIDEDFKDSVVDDKINLNDFDEEIEKLSPKAKLKKLQMLRNEKLKKEVFDDAGLTEDEVQKGDKFNGKVFRSKNRPNRISKDFVSESDKEDLYDADIESSNDEINIYDENHSNNRLIKDEYLEIDETSNNDETKINKEQISRISENRRANRLKKSTTSDNSNTSPDDSKASKYKLNKPRIPVRSTKSKIKEIIESQYKVLDNSIEVEPNESIKPANDELQPNSKPKTQHEEKEKISTLKSNAKKIIKIEKMKSLVDEISKIDLNNYCDMDTMDIKDCLKKVIDEYDSDTKKYTNEISLNTNDDDAIDIEDEEISTDLEENNILDDDNY